MDFAQAVQACEKAEEQYLLARQDMQEAYWSIWNQMSYSTLQASITNVVYKEKHEQMVMTHKPQSIISIHNDDLHFFSASMNLYKTDRCWVNFRKEELIQPNFFAKPVEEDVFMQVHLFPVNRTSSEIGKNKTFHIKRTVKNTDTASNERADDEFTSVTNESIDYDILRGVARCMTDPDHHFEEYDPAKICGPKSDWLFEIQILCQTKSFAIICLIPKQGSMMYVALCVYGQHFVGERRVHLASHFGPHVAQGRAEHLILSERQGLPWGMHLPRQSRLHAIMNWDAEVSCAE